MQAVKKADWSLLVALWVTYNRYLAHIIAHLPAEKLETPAVSATERPSRCVIWRRIISSTCSSFGADRRGRLKVSSAP